MSTAAGFAGALDTAQRGDDYGHRARRHPHPHFGGTIMTDSTGIRVSGKATPRGRFAHAKVVGDVVFVSGTSSRHTDNAIVGAEVDECDAARLDVSEQTRAVLESIREILAAAGARFKDLAQITTYPVDMNDFAAYNAVAELFDETGPARTTVAVYQLPHPHLRIGIQAVARLRSAGS